MPAKKSQKKPTKATKNTKPAKELTKEPVKEPTKDKKCACKDCDCSCACAARSQVPFYVLISMLVATMTVLVISLAFNRSVRDIFRPSTYAYNGMFGNESKGERKDENGFTILSDGAVIDMVRNNQSGFLIISEENCIGCDAFARRVASTVDNTDGIYRYNAPLEDNSDSSRAKITLGVDDDMPDFVFIKDGAVFDRIDDVKDIDDLAIFIHKYAATSEESESTEE